MKLSSSELVERIRESEVLRDSKLDAFLTEHDLQELDCDARKLAVLIVKAGLMTRFQLARIIKGQQHELVLGNNILDEIIGAGGMGTVYRAKHRRMNRRVAIKVIDNATKRSDNIMKRFQREVQAAAKLSHPNIVTAYDADEKNGQYYLVMEFVDGKDLATLVDEDGPFNTAKSVSCIIQTAKGLQYAHSQGIVHRDIKPSNLLLDAGGTVKILDMGLARLDEGAVSDSMSGEFSLTGEHQIIGTVDYMSPEQADDSKRVDMRSDIYSLGCTFYYLLTGKSPFYRSTLIKTLVAHRTEPIPSAGRANPSIPSEIDSILKSMMAKEPRDRMSNMGEVIRRLTKFDDDTDFHLAQSVGISILDDDDSETKTFDPQDLAMPDMESGQGQLDTGRNATQLGGPYSDAEPVTLPPVKAKEAPTSETIAHRIVDLDQPAVGIDLGTTFSVIAHLDSEGRPTTIANSEGELITPSVLLIDPEEVVVGKEAVKAMATEMVSVVECAKREVGLRAFPKRLRGRSFPPEVLLSWILKKLRDDAQAQIGPIQSAVITVPAYFDEVKRRATQLAGQLAGIQVLDIINEPTAAAIAYGYELANRNTIVDPSGARPLRYLVYDLGGGTFDVTLMETDGKEYRAIATDGDVRLGGRDWDERILEFVANEFIHKFAKDPREDANALGRLMRECEDVKRTLSARKRASLSYDFEGHALRIEITRKQLDEMTQDLLARTEFTTRQTLESAKLKWDEIDHILLVGGATRMPAVGEMLARISGLTPDRTLSPDESVAKGAALHAGAILSTQQGAPAPFQISNVNSHSLGVVARSSTSGKRRIAVLIPRNTSLPTQATKTFRTGKHGQNSILVQIVEGESDRPDECAKVGRCKVTELPPDLPPQTPVQITFAYDESGRLEVDVKVHQTELRQRIDRQNSLSPEEIERWQKWLDTGELEIDEEELVDFADES